MQKAEIVVAVADNSRVAKDINLFTATDSHSANCTLVGKSRVFRTRLRNFRPDNAPIIRPNTHVSCNPLRTNKGTTARATENGTLKIFSKSKILKNF